MKEKYIDSIVSMLAEIDNELFLRRICCVLRLHIEKKGETA